MQPGLRRRHKQDGCEYRQQHGRRHRAQQEPAGSRACQRAGCHGQHEAPVGMQDLEAAVAAVAHEARQHGRQADRQRDAAGQLQLDAEQQHQRRDQQFATGHAQQRSHHTDGKPERHPSQPQCDALQGRGRATRFMPQQQCAGNQRQQHRDHPLQGLASPARGPAGGKPRTGQTAQQQVDDHRPLRRHLQRRHRRTAKHQCRDHDHQADGLVDDHRRQYGQAEHQEQRQPELRAAQPDQPAEHADGCTGREGPPACLNRACAGDGHGASTGTLHRVGPCAQRHDVNAVKVETGDESRARRQRLPLRTGQGQHQMGPGNGVHAQLRQRDLTQMTGFDDLDLVVAWATRVRVDEHDAIVRNDPGHRVPGRQLAFVAHGKHRCRRVVGGVAQPPQPSTSKPVGRADPDAVEPVLDAHQIGHAGIAWRTVDTRRRAGLQHAAAIHHRQPIGQHACFVEIVRHQHDWDAQLAPQVGQQAVQPLAVHLVHRREGLIEQQQPGLARQRPRHRDALLLSARQCGGPSGLLL
uniref:Uncharacterized protein n=1 Tax=Heterosigma akashiwo TaxID=2829 RepID=A0A7S3UYH1_HETAK